MNISKSSSVIEYTITLPQADYDMLILGLDYAFEYMEKTPSYLRHNTRFRYLQRELEAAR